MPRKAVIAAAIFICLTLAVTGRAVWGTSRLQQTGEFGIAPGRSADSVWQQLAAEGYTPTVWPWRYTGWRTGAAARLQSGTYKLTAGERVRDVIARFTGGDVTDTALSVTFPEGFTAEQIAARTAAAGIGTPESYVAAATVGQWQDEFPFLASVPAGQSLEGFLFPDTYRLAQDDMPADVIRRQLGVFQRRAVDSGLAAEAAARGRSLAEWVTMASIVEREVISESDMAVVAGILWQRLDDGVGLAADATVRYAVGKWDGPLTVQDLAADSPYNTRRYRGLPPGPISNPGLRALTAAARPQPSDFYYYLSALDGQTIFSATLEEHNANKVKYLQ
ncbi:MAG: endolytic transglycosylase MltG [Candidatus Andersenbacteria bacterium CG10_big_fil_rev_8_21_14_0_10_54_11]|uniref:Endolytic murein transglycosylase n=1 Tax=Candidatus Andersenbacteria bacterium CG10_big_fil_rev_8_21_14_0_10_54_11 TaxID=1974485 RepID=A0A2M6WZY0_9BACT|nr:MAG: endolytic transglycosylase MltG [Candidatus Andersenbacteria bacterium CG10_big_fil_rev_8_21_14_0_10_54_11]